MISERELSQSLSAGLGATLFRWGWIALDTDAQPPELPLVTMTRLLADVSEIDDMCEQAADILGQITIETHTWARGYEQARMLQDEVRALVIGSGWRLRGEQDAYDSVVRAWRITAQWSGIGPLLVG